MPRATLFRCGRCGKPRGLVHECTGPARRKAWKLKPAGTFTCPSCGKAVTNPITHVCRPKSDFRRRKREHERQQSRPKPKPQSHDRNRHDYETCRDADCDRFPCRVYRDGVEAGRAQGHASGYAAGSADGYGKGMSEGYSTGLSEGYEQGFGDGQAAGQK